MSATNERHLHCYYEVKSCPFVFPDMPAVKERHEYQCVLWQCGDETCNCSAPELWIKYPLDLRWHNNPHRDLVIAGPFMTEWDWKEDAEKRHAQIRWLLKAARKYNASNRREIEDIAHKDAVNYRTWIRKSHGRSHEKAFE